MGGCQCAKSLNDKNINLDDIQKENNGKEEDSLSPMNNVIEKIDNDLHKKDDNKDVNIESNQSQDLSQSHNNSNSHIDNSTQNNKKMRNYPQEVFQLINKIRANPPAFADEIDNAIQLIKEIDSKLVYASKLKVGLNKGEEAFREAANILRTMSPLDPFEFDNNKAIECPTNENELKDPKGFMNKIVEKKKTTNLDTYFKDAVKDPFISTLLIIIDDSRSNPGKKRDAVLSREYKYISITSAQIGKSFCAYFTFSK